MYNDIIILKKETNTVDKYGDTVQTFTERTIFARVESIGQNEFYQAQAVGLRPEIKFTIADFADYQDEQIIAYQPFGGIKEDYQVLRTYRDGISLEIVCRRGIEE